MTYYYEPFIKHVAIPQHGPLSVYAKLEGWSMTKLDFIWPTARLWDDFHGHGSWYLVKWPVMFGKLMNVYDSGVRK